MGIAAAACCLYPLSEIFLPPALPLLALLVATTVVAVRFDRGGSIPSGPLLGGLTGAWIGPVLARADVEMAVRHSRSSTAAIGYLALLPLTVLAMLYFGALGWAVASLVRIPFAPRPRLTLAAFWLPLLVAAGLLGALVFESESEWRHAALAKRAESTGTDPAELTHLAENPDLRRYLARNPSTPEATLRALAEHPELRSSVAANPSAPFDLLERLSEYSDAQLGVALNGRSPPSALRRAAASSSEPVGRALLDNPGTPDDVLEVLTQNAKLTERANEVRVRRGLLNPPPSFPPVPAVEPR